MLKFDLLIALFPFLFWISSASAWSELQTHELIHSTTMFLSRMFRFTACCVAFSLRCYYIQLVYQLNVNLMGAHGGRHCCRSNICSNSVHKSDKSMKTRQWGWGRWAFRLSRAHLTNFTNPRPEQWASLCMIWAHSDWLFWKYNGLPLIVTQTQTPLNTHYKSKCVRNITIVNLNLLPRYAVFFCLFVCFLGFWLFFFARMKTCANHCL